MLTEATMGGKSERPDFAAGDVRAGERPCDERGAILLRIRGEFREMPGLSLTLSQAARLWTVEQEAAESLLGELVSKGFLRRTIGGCYAVAGERPRG